VRICLLLAAALLLPGALAYGEGPRPGAGVRVTTTPSPIIIGQSSSVLIEVARIPGEGELRAAVNVGEVEQIEPRAQGVRLRYRPPKERYPQWLVLMLWRPSRPGVLVLRIPLNGHAMVPIRTRKRSQVTVMVSGQVFGPKGSGTDGRLEMHVVVPPGVDHGTVEVVDDKGMTTLKKAPFSLPQYNQLALAVRPASSSDARSEFEITLAAAEPQSRMVRLEVSGGPSGSSEAVELVKESMLGWSGRWSPAERPAPGEWQVRAWVEGTQRSVGTQITILPLPKPPVVQKPPAPPAPPAIRARAPRRLRYNVAVTTGMVHNLGDMLSPRFGAEVGADFVLSRLRLGARLFGAICWASQHVPEPGQGNADSSVVLAPLGLGVTLRWPQPSWRLSPYALAGFVAQVVRSRSEGEQSGERSRTDLIVGGVWLVGVGLEIGPGEVFLQTGYLHSRIDNPQVEMLAGGLVHEVGYRLTL